MGASAIARAAALALHSGMYLDRIPGGIEGDLQMRAELRTDILEATPENIARNRLTTEEIDDYLAYSGWNLWDLLAARQTEGENSLIPRQEYECTGFLQCWLQYPRFFEAITAELGVDGLVDLWATGRREPGSKINQAHAWAIGQMPLIGRGLAVALGIQRADERLDELNTVVQFARRTMHGAVGPGPTSSPPAATARRRSTTRGSIASSPTTSRSTTPSGRRPSASSSPSPSCSASCCTSTRAPRSTTPAPTSSRTAAW